MTNEPSVAQKATEKLGRAADGLSRVARIASKQVAEQAGHFKEVSKEAAEKLTTKSVDPYEEAIVEYNGAFTAMNDKGVTLLRLRERSTDLIDLVELLVNSIANTPKSFETDIEQIEAHKARFLEAEEFARRDLEAARISAASAGAGLTAGAAVASMAPTAAMWVATTFGTASTGTAISTLSGASATNAALAWLGGGALAAGGGGTAAGTSLLALAGPVGWGVAGATLLASIALFTKKKFEIREAKHEALTALKENTATVKNMDAEVDGLLQRTESLRELLLASYSELMAVFGRDFLSLSSAQQARLASLVNTAKSCAVQLSQRITQDPADD